MDRKQRRRLGNIALLIFALAAVVAFGVSLKMYLARVDERVAKILEKTDTTYVSKDNEQNYSGLYVANVQRDIWEFLQDRDATTITYEFEGEPFYIELAVEENAEGVNSLAITRIVNDSKGISARMDMKNLESIEYRTGNKNQSSVLKINTKYSTDYFAMTDGNYYFLGDDIESISYMDEQFYYMTYNSNYLYLEETKSCSKETRSMIDGFNTKDYYYKYGKINFLEEFYQKLSSKTYLVEDKCSEFEEK